MGGCVHDSLLPVLHETFLGVDSKIIFGSEIFDDRALCSLLQCFFFLPPRWIITVSFIPRPCYRYAQNSDSSPISHSAERLPSSVLALPVY